MQKAGIHILGLRMEMRASFIEMIAQGSDSQWSEANHQKAVLERWPTLFLMARPAIQKHQHPTAKCALRECMTTSIPVSTWQHISFRVLVQVSLLTTHLQEYQILDIKVAKQATLPLFASLLKSSTSKLLQIDTLTSNNIFSPSTRPHNLQTSLTAMAARGWLCHRQQVGFNFVILSYPASAFSAHVHFIQSSW